ncbi:MAG: RNA polymerase factor sigma-54 [Planctomycetaceae bacterium]|nr:RNA polymerase factor sigma-54 [Planctomycetaceae bacterium]
MHLNLHQRQIMGQKQIMAPRMIQSMEILQMPYLDLQDRIDQELSENEFLENGAADPDTSTIEREGGEIDDTPKLEVERRELDAGSDDNGASDFERLVEISQDWPEDNYTSGSRVSSNQMSDDADRAHDVMANAESRPQTLQDYLLEQFHYFDCDSKIRGFGEYLIYSLDHNGRLQSSLPEIAQVYDDPISMEDADAALQMIQQLDPPGVGARDLKECLLLQIGPHTPMRDVLTILVGSHLEDLAQNRLPVIQRKTGYSIELIKDALDELKTLDPFPGRRFESEPVQRITPDVRVERNAEGEWVVELEEEYVPRLRISHSYLKMLQQSPDSKTREYIKRKVESAKWLMDAIEQRYSTLRKVAQAIVDFQSDFLENGPEHIIPLKMQQIADVVGVHVTTVSRAVDDKYISTPRGVFALKRFFGGGTTTADGEEVAWENIRRKLKEIVDNEDKDNPLSDDALVAELTKHGFQLARRTVTKYRKAMGIPSSRQRREY